MSRPVSTWLETFRTPRTPLMRALLLKLSAILRYTQVGTHLANNSVVGPHPLQAWLSGVDESHVVCKAPKQNLLF